MKLEKNYFVRLFLLWQKTKIETG